MGKICLAHENLSARLLKPMSINHRVLFEAANDFRTGSRILQGRSGDAAFPLRSAVVTAAISAELYLKCLLVVNGGEVPRGSKGHDLRNLYKALENDLQQIMEMNFQEAVPGSRPILDLLEEFHNTYNYWRNIDIYEKPAAAASPACDFLFSLVQVLDKTVRDVKPEWK